MKFAIADRLSIEDAGLVDLLGELRAEVRRRVSDLGGRKALRYRMVDSEAIEPAGVAPFARSTLRSLVPPP